MLYRQSKSSSNICQAPKAQWTQYEGSSSPLNSKRGNKCPTILRSSTGLRIYKATSFPSSLQGLRVPSRLHLVQANPLSWIRRRSTVSQLMARRASRKFNRSTRKHQLSRQSSRGIRWSWLLIKLKVRWYWLIINLFLDSTNTQIDNLSKKVANQS